jgi:aryl-alcohol dehydrogenase-like predicted oxidoreductase
MKLEIIDLIQLHCPPTEVYYRPEIFELFDQLKKEGKIQHMGVSVEKVAEALKAIEYDNVTTVQIIFNIFRQKPAEIFFEKAKQRNVGIIVRVPLASGLLTGKFSASTDFAAGDHRQFNRNGEAFDKGETFSGVDYERGIAAVEALKKIFPGQPNLAPIALKWILQFDAVSCIIPGASNVQQVDSNISAFDMPAITTEQLKAVQDVYEKYIKLSVQDLW